MRFFPFSRVWLGDIFLLWYRYCEDGSLHQRKKSKRRGSGRLFCEIICLLGNIASFCPGRVDWEPHLDRVFNGLIKDMCIDSPAVRGDLSKSLQRLLTGYARILIWGIVPNSTVIPRMRNLFKILGNIYHPSTDSSSMLFFVTFCKKLLSVLVFRLRQELSRNSRSEEIYGKMPTWSRITVTQVDDVVDILLPLCLDASLYTRRSKSLDAVVACLDYLCLLRPRLFLPRLLTALEGGFELPELPMRVTRPLQALAESCSSITALRLSLCWSSTEMGRQPGDQVPLTTTQSTGAVSKTPKDWHTASQVSVIKSELLSAPGQITLM
ncbi:unnamed protein product [Schistocephalus solidus]|uniref:BLM10_mid domain-containing protein n=1 Tax=Schistocephalus solidus TaxID=70667 RepID=A0A183TAN2_SCHSO|nr:unnamed protein product [Schistocephalus solidus]